MYVFEPKHCKPGRRAPRNQAIQGASHTRITSHRYGTEIANGDAPQRHRAMSLAMLPVPVSSRWQASDPSSSDQNQSFQRRQPHRLSGPIDQDPDRTDLISAIEFASSPWLPAEQCASRPWLAHASFVSAALPVARLVQLDFDICNLRHCHAICDTSVKKICLYARVLATTLRPEERINV
jgi:hypothetical protein